MKGSKHDLPVAAELPDGSKIFQAEWNGIAAELGSFIEGADPGPLFAGLPDDRCQCPHWGYVIKGELRYRFASHEEVFRTGDVYYAGPGHLPVIGPDTEWIEFSPAAELQATMEVVGRNLEAMAAVPAGD